VTATKTKTSEHGEQHGEHHVHVVESRVFLNVLVALLILTIITVAISRVDFGGGNMIMAMLVAIMKASLVMAVFMHLRWDTPINNIFFLGSFVLLSLLFLFSFADGFARDQLETRHDRTAPVAPAVYQKTGTVEKEFFDHLQALRGK
jgi:cytochrome c oxidase subunit 4